MKPAHGSARGGATPQSLVAPLYLVVTVGLTYLVALGFAIIVFVHIGGDSGIIFLLPLLLFVFSILIRLLDGPRRGLQHLYNEPHP